MVTTPSSRRHQRATLTPTCLLPLPFRTGLVRRRAAHSHQRSLKVLPRPFSPVISNRPTCSFGGFSTVIKGMHNQQPALSVAPAHAPCHPLPTYPTCTPLSCSSRRTHSHGAVCQPQPFSPLPTHPNQSTKSDQPQRSSTTTAAAGAHACCPRRRRRRPAEKSYHPKGRRRQEARPGCNGGGGRRRRPLVRHAARAGCVRRRRPAQPGGGGPAPAGDAAVWFPG
jgi:hypothetical protein